MTHADLTEHTLESTTLHRGRILTYYHDEVRLPNGQTGFREVLTHPGGVTILPVLPDGRILLIEQFRYALKHTLLELPAGKLDPGEAPLTAAHRELIEETGYQATQLEELTTIYTSPGFCNEKLWLFKASGLTPVENHQPLDDEFIRLRPMHPDEAWQQVVNGTIVDAKTICLLGLAR